MASAKLLIFYTYNCPLCTHLKKNINKEKKKWICFPVNGASCLKNHKYSLRSIFRCSMPICLKLYYLFFFPITFEIGFYSHRIYFGRAIHFNLNRQYFFLCLTNRLNIWKLWRYFLPGVYLLSESKRFYILFLRFLNLI